MLRNEQRLGSRVIDKAAADLVATFNIETIAASLSASLAGMHGLAELRERLAAAQTRAADVLAVIHLPHVPTRDELRERASAMFARTPSLDDIVERAHAALLDAVGARLATQA